MGCNISNGLACTCLHSKLRIYDLDAKLDANPAVHQGHRHGTSQKVGAAHGNRGPSDAAGAQALRHGSPCRHICHGIAVTSSTGSAQVPHRFRQVPTGSTLLGAGSVKSCEKLRHFQNLNSAKNQRSCHCSC